MLIEEHQLRLDHPVDQETGPLRRGLVLVEVNIIPRLGVEHRTIRKISYLRYIYDKLSFKLGIISQVFEEYHRRIALQRQLYRMPPRQLLPGIDIQVVFDPGSPDKDVRLIGRLIDHRPLVRPRGAAVVVSNGNSLLSQVDLPAADHSHHQEDHYY